jgi:Superinfection exclusion gene product 17
MVGQLKVWWIPQIPGASFEVQVASVDEAKRILTVLADYDAFQYENRIKGDYCNAGGLVRYEADAGEGEPGWCDWYDDEGLSIDELMSEERVYNAVVA